MTKMAENWEITDNVEVCKVSSSYRAGTYLSMHGLFLVYSGNRQKSRYGIGISHIYTAYFSQFDFGVYIPVPSFSCLTPSAPKNNAEPYDTSQLSTVVIDKDILKQSSRFQMKK